MGLRDFLFEKEEPETNVEEILSSGDDCSPEIEEVEVKNASLEGLIENIYEENDLSDKAFSIFKVQEAIDALPVEMPYAQKLNSVISILQISGLNKDVVLADAENRLRVLSGAKITINKRNGEKVAESEQEVENLKSMIETINQNIYQTKVEDTQASEKINSEIDKISELINFLGKEGEVK